MKPFRSILNRKPQTLNRRRVLWYLPALLLMSFASLFLHSCMQDEQPTESVVNIDVSQEFLDKALADLTASLPPNSEYIAKKYADVIERSSRHSNCDYDIVAEAGPGAGCVTYPVSDTLNFQGCMIFYTVTYTYCPYFGVQIDDVNWTAASGSVCANNGTVQSALDIANNNPYYAGYYTTNNIILSSILNDMQSYIVAEINAEEGTSWFQNIRMFIEHTCYDKVGSVFTECGTSCCERSLFIQNDNGTYQQFVTTYTFGNCEDDDEENVTCDYTGGCSGVQ